MLGNLKSKESDIVTSPQYPIFKNRSILWNKEKGPFLFSPSPPSPHYCWLLFPLLKFRKWELVVGFSPQLRVFPVLLLWVLGLDTVFLVVLLLSVWQSKQIMGASLLILRRWELVVGFALHSSFFVFLPRLLSPPVWLPFLIFID